MNSYHNPGARHLITCFLTFSIAFSVFVWLLISCNKDMGGQEFKTPSTPALSIEEARQFFSSKIPPRPTALRDDSLETESKPIEPNWGKAVSYYDEVKKQSVVEVALLDPRFSRILYNPDNTTVDTAVFSQNPQNNRLIIVKDSTGTIDYAIMKIDGAYSYGLGAGVIDSNSYQKMDEQFTGFISYVDINDQVKAEYYMANGRYIKIDSTSKTKELQGELQERWELICITVRVLVPCNCVNHTDPDGCTCEKSGGDHHGPYWEEYRVCYDVNNFTGELPAGYTPGTPVYNPDPGSGPVVGTGGGGTPGNPNSGLPPWPYQSWAAFHAAAFTSTYGIPLMDSYENIALQCGAASISQPAFFSCVQNQLITDLGLNLTLDEINWLKENFDYFPEVKAFLDLHDNDEHSINLSKTIAQSYIGILASDDEFGNEMIEDIKSGTIGLNDPVWDILSEQIEIVVKEALADLIPGGMIVTLGPVAVQQFKDGDWMGGLWTTMDIVLNEADAFIPWAKVPSITYNLIQKSILLKKVYKVMKKAKELGSEFIEKLYTTLRNRFGVLEIRNRLQWLDNLNGAKLDGVTSNEFLQDLKNTFGNNQVFIHNGNAVFKILTVQQAGLSVYMERYADSSTGWNYTIAFYFGPINATNFNQLQQKFKIRFDN